MVDNSLIFFLFLNFHITNISSISNLIFLANIEGSKHWALEKAAFSSETEVNDPPRGHLVLKTATKVNESS